MVFPGRAVALLAALAIPAAARAQPIVSPRQVAEPTAATSPAKPAGAKPATTRAAGKTGGAAASSKAGDASHGGASSSKAGAASKKPAPAPSGGAAGTPVKPVKPAKPSSKPAKPARSAKLSSKGSKSRPTSSRAGVSQARLVASAERGARGDNMPLGFEWPPNQAMQASSTACEHELTGLGVGWKPADPEGHIAAPIEVTDERIAGIKYISKWRRPPYTLDCQLARALVQIGPDLYALGVREVRWGSIYRWSNVRTQGREFPFLSRHALGLAMDIVEFVDDTGRVANVERDYPLGDPLLLGIEQSVNASGKFRIVLTPRNDPKSHHDHFHIEANPRYTAP